ncbi:MAG: hypothetical protein V8R52_11935, partial [Coprobacter fastidiosus]
KCCCRKDYSWMFPYYLERFFNNMKLIMIVALVTDGDNPVKNAYIHKKISVSIGRNFDIFIHTSGVRSTYNNDHIIPYVVR